MINNLSDINIHEFVHEVIEANRQKKEKLSRIVAKMKPADRESFLASGCQSLRIAKTWHKMTPAQREEEVELYQDWSDRLSQFME